MAEATPQEMNRFVKEVDSFMANYSKLTSADTRTKVAVSNNPALLNDYNSAVSQARILKSTIEGTVGAWNTAKAGWRAITDITSTVIGDAIDEIRSWFGYKPMGNLSAYDISPISGGSLGNYSLGSLGIVQLPAAVWIAGIVSAAFLLNQAMHKIFVSLEASSIMRANPTISRAQALTAASQAVKTMSFFGGATVPLIIAAGLAAFLILGKKR